MKLLIVIVNNRDARRLRDALTATGVRYTELGSTGGFLRERNVTLLIGLPDDQVEFVLQLIGERCRSREQVVNVPQASTRMYPHPIGEGMTVTVGGAQVFVVSVERVLHV